MAPRLVFLRKKRRYGPGPRKLTSFGLRERNLCFWHITDIDADDEHVRFWGKADIPDTPHQYPLMTQSGHSTRAMPMTHQRMLSVFAANHGPDTAMTVRGGNIPRESG